MTSVYHGCTLITVEPSFYIQSNLLTFFVTAQPVLVKTAIYGEKGRIFRKLLYMLAALLANMCGFSAILPHLAIIELCLSSYSTKG
jgi:hypothetical protein